MGGRLADGTKTSHRRALSFDSRSTRRKKKKADHGNVVLERPSLPILAFDSAAAAAYAHTLDLETAGIDGRAIVLTAPRPSAPVPLTSRVHTATSVATSQVGYRTPTIGGIEPFWDPTTSVDDLAAAGMS